MKPFRLAACGVLVLTILVTGNSFARGPGRGGNCTGSMGLTASPSEASGLIKMREEEKLARDVYLAMHARWDNPVFSNIAQSEQRHMNAIKHRLDAYRLNDPVEGKEPGVFSDPYFQSLYRTLVKRGSRSLKDAFQVGVTIEEMDIKDLEELLANTDKPDIQRVYTNLLQASKNHLSAFGNQR
jgi:hypothetical protein